MITEEQWLTFQDKGFLRLGKVLDDNTLGVLQKRINAIMLGEAEIDYAQILMQRDSEDGKNPGEQSKGHKGASLAYRKIQDLEHDPLFLDYMKQPIFRDVCARAYGPHTPIAAFRAMFMNKPANQGTFLPWHQDRWTYLDRDPQITVWTALDPATKANGCVQVIAGSHKLGLVNPSHPSGWLTAEQADEITAKYPVELLELAPGEAVILHNWLLHASDINHTDISRRAFSVCYMDADTQTTSGEAYTKIFD